MKRYQYVLGMNGKMIDKKNRSLLILGNGFDLQCGLNTTYDNFFNLKFGIILTAQMKLSNSLCK